MATKSSRFGLGCCFGMLGCTVFPMGLFAALAFLGSFPGSFSQEGSVESGTILEIPFVSFIHEGHDQSKIQDFFLQETPSVWNIRESLRAAAKDSKITGVLLDIETVDAGMAVVQEIASEIDAFRSSGKPVQALLRGDFIGEREYLLALAADEIHLVPEAGLLINGFSAEVTFWRGTLEKLGIVPYVFMLKEYKSAGEPYSRTEMSDAFRESVSALLDDFFAYLVDSTVKRRGLDEETVRSLLDRGILTAQEALKAKLVDKLDYRDQIEQIFIDKAKTSTYQSIGPAGLVGSRSDFSANSEPKIAVIFAEGPILASSEDEGVNPLDPGGKMIYGPKLAEHILEAASEPDIKAILLRVNSPGGSPVGSDAVYRAIEKAKGQGKKVVISMSDVAGSGGYWIAMGADKIVSQPLSITGSIGVVFTKMDLTGLYQLAGANISKVKLGENADIMSMNSGLDGAKGDIVLASMTQIYENFKAKVAAGRGLTVEEVERVAKGRVWTGKAAKERKLVDELGGFEEAIELARELSGAKSAKAVLYESSDNPFTELFEGLFGAQSAIPTLEQLEQASAPKIEVRSPDLQLR